MTVNKLTEAPEVFDEEHLLGKLRHYLPAQAPLKDFIHHNSLHAFQHQNFFEALKNASDTFGYKTYLSLSEYRKMYAAKRIHSGILDRVIESRVGAGNAAHWKDRLLSKEYDESKEPRTVVSKHPV
jgi:hypothetical protein